MMIFHNLGKRDCDKKHGRTFKNLIRLNKFYQFVERAKNLPFTIPEQAHFLSLKGR